MYRTTLVTAIVLTCALAAAPVDAASNRTFVSGLGNDANPCTLAQPCRTMQAAFNASAPGGEIEALDPTGYGALNITHAISIQGHGWASMNASSAGVVIQIKAGVNDNVSLRGLIIEGLGVSNDGIVVLRAYLVLVENTMIRNFVASGIFFNTIGTSALFVSKTTIAHNGRSGVHVQPLGEATYNIHLTNVEAYENGVAGFE